MDLAASADEGRIRQRLQIVRERDPKLRQQKLDAVVAAGSAIACEVCAFDFGPTHGERGHAYIEVRHRTPLDAKGRRRTTLSEPALLCSAPLRLPPHDPSIPTMAVR